jgi:hypothetical protein
MTISLQTHTKTPFKLTVGDKKIALRYINFINLACMVTPNVLVKSNLIGAAYEVIFLWTSI